METLRFEPDKDGVDDFVTIPGIMGNMGLETLRVELIGRENEIRDKSRKIKNTSSYTA